MADNKRIGFVIRSRTTGMYLVDFQGQDRLSSGWDRVLLYQTEVSAEEKIEMLGKLAIPRHGMR